jgi:hypothetical protein
MRPLVLLGAVLLLSALACGGTVVFEEDEGHDGQGGGEGAAGPTTATQAGQAVSVGPGPTSAFAVGVSVGQGGAPGTDIQPSIAAVELHGNCMPEVGPDPVGGTVLVDYRNVGGQPGSLDGLRATMTFATEVEGWVFPLQLDPTTSGVVDAGETMGVQHVKVATEGDSSFICQLCSMPGTITMSWVDAAGGEVTAYADFQLACAL